MRETRVKKQQQKTKSCFKIRESSSVCYGGSIFSFQVLNVYPVLLTDELKSSKKNASDILREWQKQAF